MSSLVHLPNEILSLVMAALDLPDQASARLGASVLAAASAPRFGALAAIARRARAARRSARTTLLLRQSLALHVVAHDQLGAVAEEAQAEADLVEAGGEAAAPAAGLLGDVATAAGAATARRSAAAARALRRRGAKLGLASSRAALNLARALIAGAAPALLPLPSPLPPMLGREDACREIASLLSLSPDPVLDLCSAAHNAMARAGEHPPLPPPRYLASDDGGGGDESDDGGESGIDGSDDGDGSGGNESDEYGGSDLLLSFLDAGSDQGHEASEEQDLDEGDDDGDDEGAAAAAAAAAPSGPLAPLRREMARRRALITLSVRTEVADVLSIAAPRLWPDQGGEHGDDENDDEHGEGAGPILLPQPSQQQQQADGGGEGGGSAPSSSMFVDAGVQTAGGQGWGPSLAIVQALKRDFLLMALGAGEEGGAGAGEGAGERGDSGNDARSAFPRQGPRRSTTETLYLLQHFLRRELESWEGLPVPL